jgi:hypothetical protein
VLIVVPIYIKKFGTNNKGLLTNRAATLRPISGIYIR